MRARLLLPGFLCALVLAVASGCGDSSDDDGAGGGSAASGSGGSGKGGSSSSGGSSASGSGGDAQAGETGSGGAGVCPEGAAGEPPADYLAEFGSGSRLQARYYAADGLPPIFAGFFDTELGVACDFLLASDDELRCLPRDAARGGHLGYADADCEQDVWQGSPGCADELGYVRRKLECDGKYAVHELSPTGDPGYYDAGNCTAYETPPGYEDAFTVGDAVDPAAFVAGTVRSLPGVCRAALAIVEASDGAFGPYEVVDVASGAACKREDGQCRPVRLAYEETLYTDDACTEAVAYATTLDAPSCRPPDFIRRASPDLYLYEVGPLVEDDLYSSPGGCAPAAEKEWIESVYELGPEVPEGRLAELSAETVGSDRLRAHVVAEAGQVIAAREPGYDGFEDQELGMNCSALPFDDGEVRCVPASFHSGLSAPEFNDPDCMVPVRRCAFGEECQGALLYDLSLDPASCSAETYVSAVWRVTGPATGYFRNELGPCVSGGTVGSDQWLVEPVPNEDLVTLTLETAE